MKKEIASICVLSCISYSANAATCTTPPSCSSLGYTQTAADCEGKNAIRCPMDNSALFCGNANDGTQPSPAKILYADHTVSSTYYPNKKAIGIVFDEKNRKAIGLEYFINQPSCMGDSTYYEVSDITSCEEEELETCATDGKINTQKIKQSCGSSHSYMNMTDKGVLKTYVPDGCSAAWCGVGQWYIPSIAELKQIYKNLRNINAALALNGIVGLLNTTCTTCWTYYDYYGWFSVFSSSVYHRQSGGEKSAYYYIYSFNSGSIGRTYSSGYEKIVLAIQY